MSDRNHRTDTLCPLKDVQAGKQIKHWLEFQLIDERGEPLSDLPYRAINDAVRCGEIAEFKGSSDAQGIIRLEGLKTIPVTFWLDADPLAELLKTRRLRAERSETSVEKVHEYTYEPSPPGFSPREKEARAAGNLYHYLRIGQLSDRLPKLDPPLADPEKLPGFHFPDPTFGGFTVPADQLDRRHVLEVCPFRAWQLVLHHQPEYSIVNGYNLGVMASLTYSTVVHDKLEKGMEVDPEVEFGSVEEFFFRQCLDLSRTPMMLDSTGQQLPAVVKDVPFDERYTTAVMLDTLDAKPSPDDPDTPYFIIENTQLFYFSNKSQVVVAWRGTHEPIDWLTDFQYRPRLPDGTDCDVKRAASQCTFLTSAGSVHDGFLQAFEIAKKLFPDDFDFIKDEARDKNLFICGHSLGGALALINSAEMKYQEPLLYTYGMPRVFTQKAVESLNTFTHFRHVNDCDMVTSVPPEAELDNFFYKSFGPLGPILGYAWSVPELLASKLIGFGDPYWHHGKIVMHYQADQHILDQAPGSDYPAYRSKDGLGAPHYSKIRRRLPERAFLYLVPSLDAAESRYAGEEQKTLMKALSKESMQRYFPPHTNPDRGAPSAEDHRMVISYMPFLHNQLLELADPARPLERKSQRDRFEQQMAHKDIPEAEKLRNEHFLVLQKLMSMTLPMTREMDGGPEALERFCREQEAGLPVEIMRAKPYGQVQKSAEIGKQVELIP
ncbi:lipase family protein [Pseudomonas sp. GCEP-101]|uniref:lipase family protein n=1 Tax=Pseudomonas sp. GCEP-101 TaxID=2974552 RepID=UPI00223C49A3|nr:lipase family protein [Pseudomonas sp. GCEP-101]